MGSGVTPVELLAYHDIQKELKRLGLPARGKKEELQERLSEARALAQPSLPRSSRRSATTRHSYTTSTIAAGKEIDAEVGFEDLVEEAQIYMDKKGAVNEAPPSDLAVATGVPLPDSAAVQEGAAHVPAKSSHRRTHRLQAPKRPAAPAFIPWQWLLFGIVIAATAAAVGLHWQNSPWVAQSPFHHLGHHNRVPGRWADRNIQNAKDAALKHWHAMSTKAASLKKTGHHHLANLQTEATHRLAQLKMTVWDRLGRLETYVASFVKGQGSGEAAGKCRALLDAGRLERVLAGDARWAGLRNALLDALQGTTEGPPKGMGVLLAAGSTAAADRVMEAVQDAMPANCTDCYLLLTEGDLAEGGPDARGALQARLTGFLEACPSGGVVVVESLGNAHPDVVPVLCNALSEQGAFQARGISRASSSMLYIMVLRVPPRVLALGDEQEFTAAVKKHLTDQLSRSREDGGVAQALQSSENDSASIANALRRRFEYVAPVKI